MYTRRPASWCSWASASICGIEPRQDAGQHVGAEALEVAHAGARERRRDPLAQRVASRVVGGAAQAEPDVGDSVGEQLPAASSPAR